MAETLGHNLERHGLARARGTGDEPVAVGLAKEQLDVGVPGLRAHAHPNGIILQHALTLSFGFVDLLWPVETMSNEPTVLAREDSLRYFYSTGLEDIPAGKSMYGPTELRRLSLLQLLV